MSYCVNISGRLYPHDGVPWNLTDVDDSSEILTPLDADMSSLFSGSGNFFNDTNLDLNGGRSGFVNNRSSEIGVVCMFNPEQMLEPWEINKNLAMLISYSVIFLIGVLGNITAMLGMVGDRKSRNATTMFLVSLSAADLLLLLVCAPLEALQYFVIQWDEDGTICKTAKYAEVLSAVSSVLNLCAVSLERFIVIVFPIRSRSVCTMSNCRRAVIVVWVVSLLLTAPVLFTKGTNPLTFSDGAQSITIYYCEDKGDGLLFAIYQAVILLLAPGLVMIICYTYVIRELWISTKNMRVLTNTNASSNRNEHEGGGGQGERRRWFGNRQTRWPSYRPSSPATANLVRRTSLPTTTAAATALALASAPATGQNSGCASAVTVTSGSNASAAVRGHEACLMPCHGPCAASNQSSSASCRGFGRNQERLSSGCSTAAAAAAATEHPPSAHYSHAHEAQLALARRTVPRVGVMATRNRSGVPQKSKRGQQARAEDARNARKQVIKMLILVVVLFLICWGSRLSMEILIKVGLDTFSQEMYYLRIVINLLPFVHSCLNPFIYSLMSKNFRRSMRRRLQCLVRCSCNDECCCRPSLNSFSNRMNFHSSDYSPPPSMNQRNNRRDEPINLNTMQCPIPESEQVGCEVGGGSETIRMRQFGRYRHPTKSTPLLMHHHNNSKPSYCTSVVVVPESTTGDPPHVDCCL